MAGSIDNNMFLKLTGQIKGADKLGKIDFTANDYKNIFMEAKKTSSDSTVSIDDFMNETKNYSKFGSEEFLNNLETLEDFTDAIEDIGLLDGNEGLSLSDLSELNKLNYTNLPQTRASVGAGNSVPFENRIQAAQTARAERAAGSKNVNAVDASSLENKELKELRNDRTNEIQNLNEARHRAQDYEKNNTEIINAQNNVNDLQSQLDQAIAEETENSESEEVKSLKEQLDAVNESIDTQKETVDGIQNDVDEADKAIEEKETAVSEAEENVSKGEESVSKAEESVSKAEEGVNTQQAALDAINSSEPQQGSFTKTDEDGNTVPDTEAYSKAHSEWLSKKSAAEKALGEAQKALEAAQKSLEDAQKALEEAKEALTTAEEELAEAQDKLAELNEQLVAAQDQLTAFEEEKSELETQISEALAEENPDSKIEELKSQLESAKSELESTKQKVKGETEADIAQYEQNVSSYDGVIKEKEVEEQKNKAREAATDEDGVMSFYKDNDKLIGEKATSIGKTHVDVETWDSSKPDNNDCLSRAIANNYDLEALGIKPGSKEYQLLEQAVMDANKNIYDENGNRTRIQDGKQHSTVLYTGDKLNLPDIGSIEGLEETAAAAAKAQGKAYATLESESTYTGNTSDPTKTKVEIIHNPDGTTYKRTTTTHLRDGSKSVTKEGENTTSTTQYDKDGKQTYKTEKTSTVAGDNPYRETTVVTTDRNGKTTTQKTVEDFTHAQSKTVTKTEANGDKTVKKFDEHGKLEYTETTKSQINSGNTERKTVTVKRDADGNIVSESTTYEDFQHNTKNVKESVKGSVMGMNGQEINGAQRLTDPNKILEQVKKGNPDYSMSDVVAAAKKSTPRLTDPNEILREVRKGNPDYSMSDVVKAAKESAPSKPAETEPATTQPTEPVTTTPAATTTTPTETTVTTTTPSVSTQTGSTETTTTTTTYTETVKPADYNSLKAEVDSIRNSHSLPKKKAASVETLYKEINKADITYQERLSLLANLHYVDAKTTAKVFGDSDRNQLRMDVGDAYKNNEISAEQYNSYLHLIDMVQEEEK